jgi:hypothetical protein
MFWDEPAEGLFHVEVGFASFTDQHLIVFADLNGDKYTDIITISSDSKSFTMHLFDKKNLTFNNWRTVTPPNCI